MKLSEFDFNLPPELIAQNPAPKRDHSDLLIMGEYGSLAHTKFYHIIDYLQPGDLIIFNDSRVINTKLTLIKGKGKINVNLNKPVDTHIWTGFARPAKKLATGDVFYFKEYAISVEQKLEAGEFYFKFDLKKISVFEFLRLYGEVPLPVYIKRDGGNNDDDINRYQNVYGKKEGSAAAPTAGLHFTEELLSRIQAKGIEAVFITLHIGAGTFLPVKTENIDDHKMHSEYAEISTSAAESINRAKEQGRRIIAVGTTALRAVEARAIEGKVSAGAFQTDIFIKPGYKFAIADLLLTNFHLPKSTLFMLVCAFSGTSEMKRIYDYAIANRMRFFSYGDAMLIRRKD